MAFGFYFVCEFYNLLILRLSEASETFSVSTGSGVGFSSESSKVCLSS